MVPSWTNRRYHAAAIIDKKIQTQLTNYSWAVFVLIRVQLTGCISRKQSSDLHKALYPLCESPLVIPGKYL
ncbi:MAG: hypothetical protein JWN30_1674 [Bacilli bacterium]|nr:hypothetical protein [Bacilli bacterium]